VYQAYEEASLCWEWTPELKAECERCDIDFFSAAYDMEAVDMLDPYVNLFKIGSGDITWLEMLRHVASKGKPVLLACGASGIGDVVRAVDAIQCVNPRLGLMQCNTNYTGGADNFRHVHLNVLSTFRTMFPELVLGLSDHTPGHAAVLGAVALGARVIEKHFTDDPSREGPDHVFSMTPVSWREMVARTRELEAALGGYVKRIEPNESDTAIVQRRCVRAARDLPAGTVLERRDLAVLRPAPPDAVFPYDIDRLIGKRLVSALQTGDYITWPVIARE
jgi:N-acetylneuraminate synthase